MPKIFCRQGDRHCRGFCFCVCVCVDTHKKVCFVFQAALVDGTAIKRFLLPRLQMSNFSASTFYFFPKVFSCWLSLSIPAAGFSAYFCPPRDKYISQDIQFSFTSDLSTAPAHTQHNLPAYVYRDQYGPIPVVSKTNIFLQHCLYGREVLLFPVY